MSDSAGTLGASRDRAPRALARAATPVLMPGQRLAIVGRSGVGKTYLARWFMLHSPQQWVAMDTKADPDFDAWRPLNGLPSMRVIRARWDRGHKVVVIRPSRAELDRVTLDSYLGDLHETFLNFGTFIDEVYQFQIGGQPRAGLTGIVARGRARNQASILGSQRPAWVPKFMFSEASLIAVMALQLEQDRKEMFDMTGRPEMFARLKKREWFLYKTDAPDDPRELIRYKPVTIGKPAPVPAT